MELYTEAQFNNDILYSEKAAIVFFTESRIPIEKQLPLFDNLKSEVKGAILLAVFFLDPSQNNQTLKEKLKLGPKFPQARFYKNNIYGETRLNKSFDLDLGTG